MKILVLSFYYSPDLCAGSFRCTALVEQLLKQSPNCKVDVISTLPNRYSSYSTEAPEYEEKERLTIRRIALPLHKNGMVDQVKSFVHYYSKAMAVAKNNEYDIVFATSSRLFTAFLGQRIASKKQLPLYLDIRDIFVDTLESVLPRKISFILSPALKLVEKYTFRKVKKVNLVSEGFLPYFKARYPNLDYELFTNGIDSEFIVATKHQSLEKKSVSSAKTILYAGNIGEGQGLHKIIPQLAEKLSSEFKIQIIGDGGRKQQLVDVLKTQNISNVELISPVPRKTLVEYYQQADILFLHLNDYEAFKKVLPSKIFEYAAFNKPILAGVSGFAAEFIRGNVSNAEVFEPSNIDSAINVINNLSYDRVDRVQFIAEYSRSNIMNKMSNSVFSVGVKNIYHR